MGPYKILPHYTPYPPARAPYPLAVDIPVFGVERYDYWRQNEEIKW